MDFLSFHCREHPNWGAFESGTGEIVEVRSSWYCFEIIHRTTFGCGGNRCCKREQTANYDVRNPGDWCGRKKRIKNYGTGFPGGAVVENLPANAGDTGSSPGLGRSHMPRSNWACEPQLLSLRVWSLCSATREATTVRGPHTAMKSGPRSPQLEKALAQKRRPNTTKNKNK